MSQSYEKQRGKDIPQVPLTKSQEKIALAIVKTGLYFFKKGRPAKISPFRGFILEGLPANGKTEIVKQAVRMIDQMLGTHEVYLRFVDSSSIAAPRWGEAEKKLISVFTDTPEKEKHIILFDDIDCLMIKRGAEVAREWHYSINSVMFHGIDGINISDIMVVATTNRPDLIDDALRSRLYQIVVPQLQLDELLQIGRVMLNDSGLHENKIDEVLKILKERLSKNDQPSIRDVQHFVVTECLGRGLWSI